ncbi:uncharacterized protein MYCGRDRAFT_97842 [Zymoseptoria tritici IPO323]|uniref:Uncharacterized protein n=1 Tax=Zymoseptoria tritici (strain CBS 115943 / IPO323) TaxID=336722 RepID=F9XRJ6_ZYMTI|nr:uncharacterized protein MYCGRDRAFT_97842 [Zymoseptoria tritici IPO323]EGP82155.1 hypothetical protein MYCGRDRAFT_97842 [Zymoseptoria tritici IPO323]
MLVNLQRHFSPHGASERTHDAVNEMLVISKGHVAAPPGWTRIAPRASSAHFDSNYRSLFDLYTKKLSYTNQKEKLNRKLNTFLIFEKRKAKVLDRLRRSINTLGIRDKKSRTFITPKGPKIQPELRRRSPSGEYTGCDTDTEGSGFVSAACLITNAINNTLCEDHESNRQSLCKDHKSDRNSGISINDCEDLDSHSDTSTGCPFNDPKDSESDGHTICESSELDRIKFIAAYPIEKRAASVSKLQKLSNSCIIDSGSQTYLINDRTKADFKAV